VRTLTGLKWFGRLSIGRLWQ